MRSHPPSPALEESQHRVTTIADNVSHLVRIINRARTQPLQNKQADRERAAQILLRSLEREGPMRASALAGSTGSDPSTISRQIATLVKDGLIERVADQADGRACLLVVTAVGRAAIGESNKARRYLYDQLLSGWTSDELDQFGHSLARFAEAYERASERWSSDWALTRSTQSANAAP